MKEGLMEIGQKEDKIIDDLIVDYPDHYQLRIYSGGIKNALQNIKGSQKRWEFD